MSSIIGLGGVFLHFKGNDQDIRDWYESYLHMDMSEYGTGFTRGQQLVLVSFTDSGNQNLPLINFRVDHLREMIQELKEKEVIITKDIEEYPYGLFAQIQDPFGNIVELWQAYEEEYRKMVEQEMIKYKKNNHRK